MGSNPQDINVDEFSKLRDAEYKGPNSLSDTADLYNQVQGSAGSAVGKANASKTEGGRFALLDNYFGKPSYSQGQKSLDNLLVQNDPNSQQAFDQMRTNANALQNNVNQAGVDLGNYGVQGKAQTEQTKNAARSAIGIDEAGNQVEGGALSGAKTGLQSAYEQRLAQQKAQEDAYRAALSQRDFAGTQGLGLENNGPLYNLDLGNYLTKPNDLNVQTAASPEQAQRLKALSALAGQQNDLITDESLVGKYDTEPVVGFDKDAFSRAIEQATSGYQAGLKPIQDTLTKTTDDRNQAINEGNRYAQQFMPDGGQIENVYLPYVSKTLANRYGNITYGQLMQKLNKDYSDSQSAFAAFNKNSGAEDRWK